MMEVIVNIICGTLVLCVLAGVITLMIDISSERILKWKKKK